MKFYNMYIKQFFLKHFGCAPTTGLFILLGKFLFMFRQPDCSWGLIFGPRPNSFLAKCETAYALHRYYSLPDDGRILVNKNYVWGGEKGVAWNEVKINALSTRSDEIEEDILTCIAGGLVDFDEVVEVGTGNGHFIKKLFDRMSTGKYTGLDLSSKQIEICKDRYSDTSIVFSDVSLQDWIAHGECSPNALLVACGCFEYFSEEELINLLYKAYSCFRYVVLCEPVNINIDYIYCSVPRGGAAYSHNYPYILTRLGYQIKLVRNYSISKNDPYYNDILVVAEKR